MVVRRARMMKTKMRDLSLTERNYVLDRIRSEITGRMMVDIVLPETALANPNK